MFDFIFSDECDGSVFAEYGDQPIDFITKELGIMLTPQQVDIVNAVWDHPRVVVKSAMGMDTETVGAVIAVTMFKVCEQSESYITSGLSSRNLGEVWQKVMDVVSFNPDLFATDIKSEQKIVRTCNGEKVEGQVIQAIAVPRHGSVEDRMARFFGYLQPVRAFINHYGDGIPDEVYQAQISGNDGDNFQSIVIFFNPKKRQGEVYRMIAENDAHVITLSALDHPNVVSGEDLYPDAITRAEVVRRINEWTRPVAEDEVLVGEVRDGYFEVPDYLVGATVAFYPPLSAGIRKVEDVQFSYKVLGEYPAQVRLY